MRLSELSPNGERFSIGEYTFTEENIIEFAKQFDPQYFHLDSEKAKSSVLGGLCASGWHVCAAWMKCNVAFLQDSFQKIAANGKTPPQVGPAKGFFALRWHLPAFSGDTLTYFVTIERQIAVPKHKNRIVNEVLCEGENQDGKLVVSFRSHVIEFI